MVQEHQSQHSRGLKVQKEINYSGWLLLLILTVPIPPACGDVKDRNRKNGLSDLDELDRNSVVVLTNTSEENETTVAALVKQYASLVLNN